MKQSLARTCIFISLILSVMSFILSLIAYNLPHWKYVKLKSTFTPSSSLPDNSATDPLLRGEVQKYIDVLYQREQKHSFGLLTHCIDASQCGQNALPSFHETDYSLCHSIDNHRKCIFPDQLTANDENTFNTKCTCQQPSYVKILNKLLIMLIMLEIIFLFVNFLRLARHYCNKYCLNDIQLRLISLISSLFSLLFLLIIMIQYNGNIRTEPLEFFESMRQHYSRIQIYAFSKDLELIIQRIENSLDITFGASFICILITFILTFISFITSITVEIKVSSRVPSTSNGTDDNEKVNDHNNYHRRKQPRSKDRYVPSEQIRFARQTKV